jgi:rubrerythrin
VTLETIKDILDWTRRLHQELADAYRDGSETITDERARMLLNYVADHEARIAETIKHYEDDTSVRTMDTWVQDYFQHNPFFVSGMQALMATPGLKTEEVLDATVKFHQNLIGVYKDLAESAPTERMRELFENLQSLEQHELMRMVHTAERFNDV